MKVKIARNIKKQRIQKNMSQKELASKVGISQQSLSKMELGYKSIPSEILFEICNVLKICPGYFVPCKTCYVCPVYNTKIYK